MSKRNRLTELVKPKTLEQANIAELAATDNQTVKNALVAAIEQKEQEKLTVQADIQTYSDPDKGIEQFIGYAVNHTEDLRLKYWDLDWDRRKRCELLLFPDGIFTTRSKKVYTPSVSAIYRDTTKQKAPLVGSKTPKNLDGGPQSSLYQLF